MKNRIMCLLLAFLMVLSTFPAPAVSYAEEAEEPVAVWYFNSAAEAMEKAETVALYRGGEQYLSAFLREGLSGDIQWQIEAAENLWVDIQGGTGEDLRVSYGMVASLLKNDTVKMRCRLTAGGEVYYSDAVAVTVTEEDNRPESSDFSLRREVQPPEPLPAPVGLPLEPAETETVPEATVPKTTAPAETVPETTVPGETVPETTAPEATAPEETIPETTAPEVTIPETTVPEETVSEATEETRVRSSASAPPMLSAGLADEDVAIYTITIEYVYADDSKFAGQRVALPYIAEVAEGGSLNELVTSPNCVGYSPDLKQIVLAIEAASGNRNYKVEYSPAEVSYTVRHYQQNIDDDEYTWVDTTLATGKTEALTSDNAAKSYTGFTALSHYHEEIAADSSTTVDIYYDRNYYLMSFELDGGYGVQAVYARYGADISVSDPQRAGYSFNGWSLDGVTYTSLPGTMPAGNSSYRALWNAGNSTYTIAYWLENADADGEYDFVGAAPASANSGDSVSGNDSAVANSVFTSDERQYYAYNGDKTDVDITVAGDGSSVVNVYYDRNEYTLKFYYARLEGTTYDIADNTNNSSANSGTAASASWVGNFRTKPTLDSKYTEQSEVIGGNTYYYFTITEKYGASLSDLWPNAPLTSAGDYNFISWGTHYGSGYYYANSNKNIKGVYSIMDSGLLIDPTVTTEKGVNHWMVGYWNTNPTMYTYEIYYSVLIGETVDRTYNNGDYKKVAKYTVGSTDTPSGQTALSFDGVTSVGKDYDSNKKVDGAVIRFYYQRNENTVTLDDNYGDTTTYTIPYGATLSSYITAVPTPDYPDDLPDGAYEFGGWYQSKDGIGALDTSITMPNGDLIYYAKWSPKVYTITITDGTGTVLSTEQVKYGTKATKPTDPIMNNAIFIGWYYKDTAGEEKRFDFDNMAITQDMAAYAKWRSNVMKEVVIHYVVEDESGNRTPIADSETLMLRVGQIRTFDAKTGLNLYEEYRSGCFPTTATHSITPAETSTEEDLTYTFVYKQYGAVPYKVEFYVQLETDEDGDGELDLRPAFKNESGNAVFVSVDDYESNSSYTAYVEEHPQNDKAVVTELYVPDALADTTWSLPDAYVPNALKIQRIIVPGEDNAYNDANTIRFIYTYEKQEDPDNPVYKARYLVQHYIENVDYLLGDTNAEQYVLYRYSDNMGIAHEKASDSAISIPGYTYSSSVTDQKKQNGTVLDDDTMTGIINADDSLELNFYYTVNPYPYQVMYLEKDTNRVLLEAKTHEGGTQMTGLYGAKVTEDYVPIDGYDVDAQSKSIYIQQEAGTTASINTIVFYYSRKSADLIITKTVAMDEEQAEHEDITGLPQSVLNQEFEFVVTAKKGFHKSVYDYVVYDVTKNENGTVTETKAKEGKATASTFVMSSITIKNGQKLVIEDLSMGDYTVTETHVVGFRTSVDGTIKLAHDVKLETAGSSVKVDYVNTFPFYTGDLVVMKEVDKDEADPAGTHRVRITLNPARETREIDRVITFVNKAGEAYQENGSARTFTVPALTKNSQTSFEIIVDVPAGDEVKLVGAPAGTFIAEEIPTGSDADITNYYGVISKAVVHQNDTPQSTKAARVESEIHGGHPTAVIFRNTYKKGALTINKTVTQEYANDNWQSDTFTFTLTGKTELPAGDYAITVGDAASTATVDAYGNVTIANAPTIALEKATDHTAAQWSGGIALTGLPAGYYTVTESAAANGLDKYTLVPETGKHENLLVNDPAEPAEAAFTNTYKRTKGNLTLEKMIALVEGTTMTVDTEKEFKFTIQLQDRELTATDWTGVSVTPSESAAYTLKNGIIHVTLKHMESIAFTGLPVGEYTVTEGPEFRYQSDFGTTDENGYSSKNVTIETGKTENVTCTNLYPIYVADLTIKKEVSGTGMEPGDSFVFYVSGADDQTSSVQNIPVVITYADIQAGNCSVTIADLPLGKYTVREDTAWSWRYTLIGEASRSITLEASGNTVIFENTRTNNQWLSGTDAKENNFSSQ